MAKSCIGIDFGGTFIKFGLVDADRQPSETFQLPTPTDGGCDSVVEQILAGAGQLIQRHGLSKSDIVGVGIGSPGPIDIPNGIVIAMPNIRGMDNCPLRNRVADGLDLPAVLENDANAAAYGEYICGAGEGTGSIVMLTLGTGVGSGIIIDGRILHGSHSIGAELGHMIIVPGGEQCNCGQKGCLERYCSATYMAQRAMRLLEKEDTDSSLKQLLIEKGGFDARDIEDARKAGDKFAARMWDDCARHLAIGCVNISRIFDPDEIILGGGMAKAGDELLVPVRRYFEELHWSLTEPKTKIVLARLGNDAGAIGAAGVAWVQFGGD